MENLGFADVETRALITSDPQFQFGSVTKAFTAMAIMILADEGKLRFDDPLEMTKWVQ
jgi:CubicO group peptidase (beta-lactamase class C family)